MTRRVVISPLAAQQIAAAEQWWLDHSGGLSSIVSDEVERILDLLAEVPNIGKIVQAVQPGVRRIAVPRIGYHLYYRLDEEGVIRALSLWHKRRGSPPRL